MKKKFLSLMMAAAVVATTSVSAFADDYSWSDKGEQDVQVNITGDVADTRGNTVSGTLSVSIPTATTFTVGQSGKVTTSPITVQNRGTQAVDVYAYKFSDNTPTAGSGITVVGKDGLASAENYSTLTLRLNGTAGDAYLKSEENKSKNGVYKDLNCQTSEETGVKLVSVAGNKTGTITLEGTTNDSVAAPTTAIQDKFVLTLKIKKANS